MIELVKVRCFDCDCNETFYFETGQKSNGNKIMRCPFCLSLHIDAEDIYEAKEK